MIKKSWEWTMPFELWSKVLWIVLTLWRLPSPTERKYQVVKLYSITYLRFFLTSFLPGTGFAAQRLKTNSGVISDFSFPDLGAQMLHSMVKGEILPLTLTLNFLKLSWHSEAMKSSQLTHSFIKVRYLFKSLLSNRRWVTRSAWVFLN